MKRLIFILCILCNGLFLYSQNNATGVGVLGFYFPSAMAIKVSFSQERFIKEKVSIETNLVYSSIIGEGGEGKLKSISLGPRFYFNSTKNDRRKYWVNPYLTHVVINTASDDGSALAERYNVGVALGKRKYFNEKFFLDFGLGLSYGYCNYIAYINTQTGPSPADSNLEDGFSFFSKIVLNLGIRY